MRSLLTTSRQLRKNHMGVGFKSQPARRFLLEASSTSGKMFAQVNRSATSPATRRTP